MSESASALAKLMGERTEACRKVLNALSMRCEECLLTSIEHRKVDGKDICVNCKRMTDCNHPTIEDVQAFVTAERKAWMEAWALLEKSPE